MKHFIITGASKGLGEGIAMALLDKGHHIVCISRNKSEALEKMALAKDCKLESYLFDLSNLQNISGLFENIFSRIDLTVAEGVYLVNNAGVIEPVGRIESNPVEEVEKHIRINLLAPMTLSALFIEAFKTASIQKRIMNISSGAANFPYYGWSSYCTSKAGVDMFSRCIYTEQQQEQYPVEVMSVAPGIIDTNMQDVIRASTEEQFIHKEKFIEYKEKGMLVAPSLAGKRLARLLLSEDFVSGEVIDLRD